MSSKRNTVPDGLGAQGRRLWEAVTAEFVLAIHEELMLLEACRVTDHLDDLAKAAVGAPLTVENSKGDQVANPLLTEARQQQIVMMRLLASMRMPEADAAGTEKRPQRRGAARKSYAPRGLAAVQ